MLVVRTGAPATDRLKATETGLALLGENSRADCKLHASVIRESISRKGQWRRAAEHTAH